MPLLKMYIGRLLVATEQLDYTDMKTASERQFYQERVAADMYKIHIRKITQSDKDPVFFVDQVQSKMNEIDFLPEKFSIPECA